MIVIYFSGFIVTVAIFGIVTNRLNQKTKCDHVWDDQGDEGIKCAKCNKSLVRTYRDDQVTA